uniref:Uncharacterized protein n=1 Tax=Oryza punctata TaxID=4537 RepID=A0A0E0LC26_ORYPU
MPRYSQQWSAISPTICANIVGATFTWYSVQPVTFEEFASKATDIENYTQFMAPRSKPYSRPVEKSNPRDKLIDDGVIDADLLKSLKKGKKIAANVTIVQEDLDKHHSTVNNKNVDISLKEKLMIDRYTPPDPPAISTKIPRARTTAKKKKRTPVIDGQWRALLFTPAIYQRSARREGGVYEDDGSLYFPDDEPLEVDQIQLRSGRQTADARPPPNPKNPRRKDVASDEMTNPSPNVSVKYDVISHLKKIPAMLSVYDTLCMSSNLCKAFTTALSFPEGYRVEVSQTEAELTEVLSMTFAEEDILLGNKKHNQPLLMYGEIDDYLQIES